MAHRLLHTRWLYSWTHKIHHEFKNPIAISAIHVHPIEFVIGNVLPQMVGAAILGSRMHLASFFGLLFVRSWEGIDGHCGYSLSWSPFRLLPLQPEGDYHDFHHEGNVGNYGSFTKIWDTVFGTNTSYFSKREKRD